MTVHLKEIQLYDNTKDFYFAFLHTSECSIPYGRIKTRRTQ